MNHRKPNPIATRGYSNPQDAVASRIASILRKPPQDRTPREREELRQGFIKRA